MTATLVLLAPLIEPPSSSKEAHKIDKTTNKFNPIEQVNSSFNALTLDAPPDAIPRVCLGTPFIDCTTAAHLATTLVSHVLFLKSQVPLCVQISLLFLMW